MSISLLFCRTLSTIQVRSVEAYSQYYYVEAYFTGYPSNPRGWKSKRFTSIQKLLAYLNKLDVGGWMTDEDYALAWSKVLVLNEAAERDPDLYHHVSLKFSGEGEVPFAAALPGGRSTNVGDDHVCE